MGRRQRPNSTLQLEPFLIGKLDANRGSAQDAAIEIPLFGARNFSGEPGSQQ
jgi:hypothetical protein